MKCKLIEVRLTRWRKNPNDPAGGKMRMLVDRATGERPVPGDMWYDPEVSENYLSDFYWANNAHRDPLVVVLPNGDHFVIDAKCTNEGEMYGGWTVTGEPPLITVQPSIDVVGRWHGFLTNGVLT